MKLPSFRRLFTSDYPKQFQSLVDTLSVSLNNGIEVLYEALNNALTLEDNINCTVKNITVTTDANGKLTQNAAFTLNNTNKVDVIFVGLATNTTNSNHFPIATPFITGAQNGNVFNITNISGLQAGEQYNLRVVVFQQ